MMILLSRKMNFCLKRRAAIHLFISKYIVLKTKFALSLNGLKIIEILNQNIHGYRVTICDSGTDFTCFIFKSEAIMKSVQSVTMDVLIST